MKIFFKIYLLTALAVGGSVRGQSSIYNPPYKPFARIQIPSVQPRETDGIETNVTAFSTWQPDGTEIIVGVTNIAPKLDTLRSLSYCDFIVYAVDGTKTTNQVVYAYTSTGVRPSWSCTPSDTSARCRYVVPTHPETQAFEEFEPGEGKSIQTQSGNSATSLELWPTLSSTNRVWLREGNPNISWHVLLFNGVDVFRDSSGNTNIFPVSVEFLSRPPEEN